MEIVLKKTFVKELKKVPQKIQKSVQAILENLAQADTLESAGVDHKYMEGQQKGQNFYRIRVGGWRMGITYIPPDERGSASSIIITILSRGDIYKKFPPQ